MIEKKNIIVNFDAKKRDKSQPKSKEDPKAKLN